MISDLSLSQLHVCYISLLFSSALRAEICCPTKKRNIFWIFINQCQYFNALVAQQLIPRIIEGQNNSIIMG